MTRIITLGLLLLCVATIVFGASDSSVVIASAAQTSGNKVDMKSYQAEGFEVQIGQRKITARVLSPAQLAPDPLLLLSFSSDRNTALYTEPYNLTAKSFLEHGNRVASFDLPNHGERVNKYGAEIAGMRNAFVNGEDPFAMFVQDGTAVIDRCIAAGLAQPGRIAICGTSRAGYLALRLLAAEPRIAAAAVYAPVTDWRALTEFAADRERADVAGLQLSKYADALAGRPISMVIGNHDGRVGTDSCCRFYLDLMSADARHGFDDSHLDFQVRNISGHVSLPDWYQEGAAFLLESVR